MQLNIVELAIYHKFLYRSAEGLVAGATLFGGLAGVELACGTGKVLSVFCFGGFVVGGGSGVLVCRGGVGSSLMGFRRILSEKHLSRIELEIRGINTGRWKKYKKTRKKFFIKHNTQDVNTRVFAAHNSHTHMEGGGVHIASSELIKLRVKLRQLYY